MNGNPHWKCGIAEADHRAASCADCGMRFVAHSLDELNREIAAHRKQAHPEAQ
jgi:predicted small metal-binding protein